MEAGMNQPQLNLHVPSVHPSMQLPYRRHPSAFLLFNQRLSLWYISAVRQPRARWAEVAQKVHSVEEKENTYIIYVYIDLKYWTNHWVPLKTNENEKGSTFGKCVSAAVDSLSGFLMWGGGIAKQSAKNLISQG